MKERKGRRRQEGDEKKGMEGPRRKERERREVKGREEGRIGLCTDHLSSAQLSI